ncbi:kinase-like domain-containing protein [Mycena sanguinolenta]|nr:kinase-like domain-containing protein [Mycena sanguinolenta]
MILSFLTNPTQWLRQEIPSSAEGFPASPLWISAAFGLDDICGHLIDVVSKELCTDLDVVIRRLVRLLRDPGTYLELSKTDAQAVLDLVQTLLDHDSFLPVRSSLFVLLLKLSRVHKLYPTCFVLTGLQDVEEYPAECGSTNDIYQAVLHGNRVSVKPCKPRYGFDVENLPIPESFGHEALIWRQLSHPNVLPFFGLSHFDKRLSLVSPWMENGTMVEYLRTRSLNIGSSFSLILDVAMGLECLHKSNVVHGNLNPHNILITSSHRACISNFGLASLSEAGFVDSSSGLPARNVRYQAPELFTGESLNSLASDVYAFAYICQKVLTWEPPFVTMRTDAAVMTAVLNGVRPTQPASSLGIPVLDNLWSLMHDCWKADPRERPVIGGIIKRLCGSLIGATTGEPRTEWNQELTCKFRRSLQAQPLLPAINEIDPMFFDQAHHGGPAAGYYEPYALQNAPEHADL